MSQSTVSAAATTGAAVCPSKGCTPLNGKSRLVVATTSTGAAASG
ncbi:hypothetical protein [Kitasatospora nipponensis]